MPDCQSEIVTAYIYMALTKIYRFLLIYFHFSFILGHTYETFEILAVNLLFSVSPSMYFAIYPEKYALYLGKFWSRV